MDRYGVSRHPSSLWIQFECEYVVPNDGFVLAVCGSIPELGNWNASAALIADQHTKDSGKWVAGIHLPTNSTFAWKWVVLQRPNFTPCRWEEIPDRVAELGEHNGTFLAPWNTEMAFDVIPFARPRGNDSLWTNDDAKQLQTLLNLLSQQTNCETSNPEEPEVQPKHQPVSILGRGILDIVFWLPRCVGRMAVSAFEFIKQKLVGLWQGLHN
ncbi:uncharacterized protein LOC134231376 [Saccostrea cucullata]|uniref:uncharacterized protein LOC134231376 n=1 Tax=Saccostrea cuccullata TaxID=36930 RepID=UPI002ED406E2